MRKSCRADGALAITCVLVSSGAVSGVSGVDDLLSGVSAPVLPHGGATVPWIEYEAEAAKTNGEILVPSRTLGTIASESSGRSAVKLVGTADFVQFTALEQANSIVVRFVIPDSRDGNDRNATLSLYVNDVFRQKLNLTSKYSWSYGGAAYALKSPDAGGAHHFYDEARALVGDIPPGATVKLQKDGDDSAEYYVIDLIDLENVGPPSTKPHGYFSIVDDCGAVPDDGQDDGPAIQSCIRKARAARTGVWMPRGTFESLHHGLEVADVVIQGAGMWYTTLHGPFARFNCVGNNCRYADFAILGETTRRNDKVPENGFNGGAGTGSRLDHIWVEHTKVGYWVGRGTRGTDGLVIANSRFRNLYADGINFCNGTSHSIVENSHFRNTGDDALASWSPATDPINTGNVFRFNTVQVPWRANCFAVYGGRDNRIENNRCFDVVNYPGILIAQEFKSNAFSGETLVAHNALIRAGGPMWGQEQGALKIAATEGDVTGVKIHDLLIDGATFAGIQLVGSHPIRAVRFESIDVVHSGSNGIEIKSDVSGDSTFSEVIVSSSGAQALRNSSPPSHYKLVRGPGNRGWQVRSR